MKSTTQFLATLGSNARRIRFPATGSRLRRLALTVAVVAAMALAIGGIAVNRAAFADDRHDDDGHWVGTWSASPVAPDLGIPGLSNNGFNNQTLRLIVHTSIGGDDARVRISNAFGTNALVIGAAHIALRGAGAAIVPGSDRALTFSGASSTTIPPGALVVSDPVELDVPALGDLAVSIFLPGKTGPATWHFAGLQTSYISSTGDFTGSTAAPFTTTTQAWFFLTGVEVKASERTRAIVAMGDSITDGTNSTPDTNHRWPNFLAQRLLAHHVKLAVLDEGIAGNRILHDFIGPNALARFDRDVLTKSGVSHVIVLESINDIGIPGGLGRPAEAVTADEIIAGLRQLITRAHERGLKIFGGTLTPFEGTTIPGYFTPAGEVKRQAVNHFIRTSGAFDGVIDFDVATRDPSHPTRFLPAFDSGDHLHPSDAGYQAMANAINLELFERDDDD